MNHSGLSVTTGTAAHLVKLNRAKRHMVEHDMSDIGQVDALTEGRGRDDAAEAAISKRLLDAAAIGTREPGVIERDMGRTVWHALAQRLGKCHGLVARIDVDNGLLPRRHNRHQAIFAACEVAIVLELQVLAHGLVNHRAGNGQYASELCHDRSRRGSRCRHDNGIA